MKRTKKKTKYPNYPRESIIPVRIPANSDIRKRIEAKAKRHTEGNVSAWMRHAASVYTPKPGEEINLSRNIGILKAS